MRKFLKSAVLLLLAVLLATCFAACGEEESGQKNGPLQVNTIKIIPTAYQYEAYDLQDVILMEEGVLEYGK